MSFQRGIFEAESTMPRMKKLAALFFCFVAASASAQQTIVIKAGTLIDGRSSDAKKNQTIVIRGNRIVSVGETLAKFPEGTRVIDLSNMTVLPGTRHTISRSNAAAIAFGSRPNAAKTRRTSAALGCSGAVTPSRRST